MMNYNTAVALENGVYSVIDEREIQGEMFYLMEHNDYGSDVACIVVDSNGEIVADDIWNGLDEFEFEQCYIEVPIFSEEPNADGSYDLLGYRREYVREGTKED